MVVDTNAIDDEAACFEIDDVLVLVSLKIPRVYPQSEEVHSSLGDYFVDD